MNYWNYKDGIDRDKGLKVMTERVWMSDHKNR